MTEAACVDKDPEMFFPEKGQSVRGNEAIMVCFSCPVREECEEYRVQTNSRHGIWAGKYTDRHGK